MKKNKGANDSIIAIAWPEGPVPRNKAWYDIPMKWIGFCDENDTYKVGHAAGILVERATGRLAYFDFGRYICPHQYGRVRDMETDPALEIPIKAKFDTKGNIKNIEEILIFANNHKPFHGVGNMYASVYHGCSFQRGYTYAKNLQQEGLVPYGPFVKPGTNCSRFINTLCRVSFPCWYTQLRWRFAPTVTPTTKHNVLVNHNYYYIEGRKLTHHKRLSLLGKLLRNGRKFARTTREK